MKKTFLEWVKEPEKKKEEKIKHLWDFYSNRFSKPFIYLPYIGIGDLKL